MEIEKIIDDLCLIDNVMVDYSQGRRRGLTDEETEDRAIKAVFLAMEALERLIPKCPDIENGWPALCPNCKLPLADYEGAGIYMHWTKRGACDCGQRIDWDLLLEKESPAIKKGRDYDELES